MELSDVNVCVDFFLTRKYPYILRIFPSLEDNSELGQERVAAEGSRCSFTPLRPRWCVFLIHK